MANIESIQRQLALTQRQIKDLSIKIKNEKDPDKKGILSKKMIDLNTKRQKLDAELDDEVGKLHTDAELQVNEGFIKWRNYMKTAKNRK